MSKKSLVAIIIAVILLLLAGYITYKIKTHADAVSKDESARTLFATGKNAIVYTDTSGKPTSIAGDKGKVIVVNVWASWSPYATIELPILDKLGAEFKDKNVQIMAVDRKENYEQAQRFLNTQPAFTNIKTIIDVDDNFYKAIDGYAMPETIVYNKDGVIVSHIRGVIVEDELRKTLTDLTK